MIGAGHMQLGRRVSGDVGMEFRAHAGTDANGDRWIRLTPVVEPTGHAFDVKAQMTWRRVRLSFEPQKFAGELVRAMGESDEVGQTAFCGILEECVARGATVRFGVNGHAIQLDDQAIWGRRWRRIDLSMSKRLAGFDGIATAEELNLVRPWASRFLAAVLALAPLETQQTAKGKPGEGFEEGAARVTRTIRYERDRRNRAAAIAIHGTACLACGVELGTRYGMVAEGFIEVHHVVPVASMGADYRVDPVQDLVPLCPNCHAVAHRRDPPLTVDEIKGLLRKA